jgi:hypothetical protein
MTMESDQASSEVASQANQKGAADLNVAFALGEVHGQLNVFMGQMKDSLDGVRQAIAATSSAADMKVAGLETRVAVLEKWHWKVAGAAALVGTLAGWAVEWAIHHV